MTATIPPLTDAQLAERLEYMATDVLAAALGMVNAAGQSMDLPGSLRLAAARLRDVSAEHEQALEELKLLQAFVTREIPASEKLLEELRAVAMALGLPPETEGSELVELVKALRASRFNGETCPVMEPETGYRCELQTGHGGYHRAILEEWDEEGRLPQRAWPDVPAQNLPAAPLPAPPAGPEGREP